MCRISHSSTPLKLSIHLSDDLLELELEQKYSDLLSESIVNYDGEKIELKTYHPP